MALQGGNIVANYVVQGRVQVQSSWTALQVGSTPHKGRFQIRIFVKGNPGDALALAYANQDSNGNFTTPSPLIKDNTIYPGGRTWIEPLSDRVALYGRLVAKAGSTRSTVNVIVTEFS